MSEPLSAAWECLGFCPTTSHTVLSVRDCVQVKPLLGMVEGRVRHSMRTV